MPTSTSIPNIADVQSLATTGALSVWNYASDAVIIIVLFLVFLLLAYRIGRGPFVGTLLSFYAAYAVYAAFPFVAYLPSAPAPTALMAHVGLYIALVVLFYIILRRVVVSDFLYIGTIALFLLSFLGAGFILALAYHTFSVTTVYQFSPTVDLLFAPDAYFFWWFISPGVGLFFLAR